MFRFSLEMQYSQPLPRKKIAKKRYPVSIGRGFDDERFGFQIVCVRAFPGGYENKRWFFHNVLWKDEWTQCGEVRRDGLRIDVVPAWIDVRKFLSDACNQLAIEQGD